MKPQLGTPYHIEDCLVDHGHLALYTGFFESKPVVFKCLDVTQISDWSLIQSLEYEAEVLSQIQHPRIPEFVDLYETPNKVMTLIQGQIAGNTLYEKQGAQGTLNESDVCQIAAQCLCILQAMHGHFPPLLHLDLKPSNLMQNDQGELFVIDFGNAIIGEPPQSLMGGTPGFSPPEQLGGNPVPQSDLYALGATCIQLLSGHEITTLIAQQKIDFWDHVTAAAPFKNWLEIMVHPQVEMRFQHAKEALDQLILVFPELKIDLQLIPLYIEKPEYSPTHMIHTQHSLAPPYLDNYQFNACLKQNGGTSTWLASALKDPEKSQVVIKHVQISQADTLNELKDIEREVQHLQALDHPAFPKLLGFEKQPQNWFMIQEWLPGQTLQSKIEEGWQPKMKAWVSLAYRLLDALKTLHDQSPPLIHRDIQPENIMIHETGVYLLDFGGAEQRVMLTGSGGSTRTGSFGFTAPEQYVGLHSPSSDLYALGMCLIYILRQRSPASYQWENQELVLEDLPIPKGLQGWLKRLTHMNPDERLQSAELARVALVPQSQAIHEAEFQKSTEERREERKKDLAVQEALYAQKHQEKLQLHKWHPWTTVLKLWGLNMPPTRRLMIGSDTDQFHLCIPPAQASQEKGLAVLRLLTKLASVLAFISFVLGLLAPLFFMGVFPFIFLLFYTFKNISPTQKTTLIQIGPAGITWQQLQGLVKDGGFESKIYSLWHQLSGVNLDSSQPIACQVSQIKTSWFLSDQYFKITFRHATTGAELATVSGVYLLTNEALWLENNLSGIAQHLYESA